jgi:hypothetical protein
LVDLFNRAGTVQDGDKILRLTVSDPDSSLFQAMILALCANTKARK